MSPRVLPPTEATEWIPPADHRNPAASRRAVWVAPVLLAGAAGWLGAGPGWGLISVAVVTTGLWGWIRVQGRFALRSLGAVPLRAEQAPRLFNIAAGLADGDAPGLWVIPDGGPNALVCWAGGPVVAVSQSLLDDYSRTELEAVVAHCLVRLGDCAVLSEALALGRLGITIAPSGRFSHDAAAAALTRYPPALAMAIAKAQPGSARFAPLWFVSDEPGDEDRSARTEMLLDL